MTNWKQDCAISIFMLGLSLLCGITALGYPSDSNTFPLLLSVLLGILAVALGIKALMHIRDGAGAKLVEFQYYRGILLQILIIVAFILTLPVLGYLPAGFLLCILTACGAGYGKRKVVFLFSFVTSVCAFVVFKLILQVPLPAGLLFG